MAQYIIVKNVLSYLLKSLSVSYEHQQETNVSF